jgi:hypothetical protein
MVKHWKYKVVALSDDAKASTKTLTDLGAAGWELVAVHGNGKGRFAYLKIEAEAPSVRIRL